MIINQKKKKKKEEKNLQNSGFCRHGELQNKTKEEEETFKSIDFAKNWKAMIYVGDGAKSCNWGSWNDP